MDKYMTVEKHPFMVPQQWAVAVAVAAGAFSRAKLDELTASFDIV